MCALLLIFAVVLGAGPLSRATHETLSLPLAFAAGAVLAALADTLMPEAYEHGGPTVALSTAAGFLLFLRPFAAVRLTAADIRAHGSAPHRNPFRTTWHSCAVASTVAVG